MLRWIVRLAVHAASHLLKCPTTKKPPKLLPALTAKMSAAATSKSTKRGQRRRGVVRPAAAPAEVDLVAAGKAAAVEAAVDFPTRTIETARASRASLAGSIARNRAHSPWRS